MYLKKSKIFLKAISHIFGGKQYMISLICKLLKNHTQNREVLINLRKRFKLSSTGNKTNENS